MSEFIRTMNQADALARLYHEGAASAVEVEAGLLFLGFYDVEFVSTERATYRVEATWRNVSWPLGEGLTL